MRRKNGGPRKARSNRCVLSHARRFCIALGAVVCAFSTTAHAYLTVGPDGTYSTIQAAVANSADGDQVRVEVKLCTDIHGFQYVCPYAENIVLAVDHSIYLVGGWHADFQTRYADDTRTMIKGTGADKPVFRVQPGANATVEISGFDVNDSGIAAALNTTGIQVVAIGPGNVVNVYGNTIRNNSLLTATGNAVFGGAGVSVYAGSGTVGVDGNTIQSNVLYGGGTDASNGAGVYLAAIGGVHISFTLNHVINNSVSNPNGGGCHGGGLFAKAVGAGAKISLSGNVLTGNQQFACTTGATGDAAEITASNTGYVEIDGDQWTSNNTANDPGVYEVFMQADNYGSIRAGNGLITHGTWGGLYAQADATATIPIINFTIADNPVLGFRGVGSGAVLWNSILWNDGTPGQFDAGAYSEYCLTAADPLFVDSVSGNYRLTEHSPAVNAGYNNIPGGPYYYDLDGFPRPYAGDGLSITDIGAYEFRVADRIFLGDFE